MAAQITQPFPVLSSVSAYAAGTAYSLTDTSAALSFGTTSPSITLAVPGTYLIYANSQLVGANAFITAETATLKLRRTNNTASDLAKSTTTISPTAGSGIASTLCVAVLPPVIYSTTNSNDVISIFGVVSSTLGLGTIDINEASIVAVKIG